MRYLKSGTNIQSFAYTYVSHRQRILDRMKPVC
jgi:hypothetical protein